MRVALAVIVTTFSVLSYGTYVRAQTGTQSMLTTTLVFGSLGPQVMTLQRILNLDPDTRVARSGPGSPENETSYFGPLTKTAVIRFQEKYASEILAPVALTRGSGYVGLYTRTKLNALSISSAAAGGVSASDVPPASIPTPTTVPSVTPTLTTASQNPNLKDLDTFLAALDAGATKKGISAAEIDTMKAQVVKVAATTTDLRAAFFEMIRSESKQAARDDSLIGRILIPIGGALLFALPCNGGVWNLSISPLPPAFPTILSYLSGSQAFLSYNIPATSWLLGEYGPGPGACFIGPFYIYSEGLITPMVGSSPA